MRFQAVLFDFDGTLVDSEALHYQSWMKVLAPYQITYTEHDFCDEFSGVPTLKAAHILKENTNLRLRPAIYVMKKMSSLSQPLRKFSLD